MIGRASEQRRLSPVIPRGIAPVTLEPFSTLPEALRWFRQCYLEAMAADNRFPALPDGPIDPAELETSILMLVNSGALGRDAMREVLASGPRVHSAPDGAANPDHVASVLTALFRRKGALAYPN